jgi:talin
MFCMSICVVQAAGNAVKRATDNLVRAAQQAIQQEEERSLVRNRRMVGGIAQEINARSEVLRIERQLEEARGRLTAIRQAKYKMKGGDTSASDTEPEGYGSGYESFTTRYTIETMIRQYLQGLRRNFFLNIRHPILL